MGGKLNDDAVVMQQFCVLMAFNDALPVLSTKNDGHCHHLHMGVFPDPQSNNIKGHGSRDHTLLNPKVSPLLRMFNFL